MLPLILLGCTHKIGQTHTGLVDFFNPAKTSSIDLIHINCRSKRNKFSELLQLVEIISGPLTAIAVTETWLTLDTQDLYRVPGYKFVSHPHIHRTGGGLFLYK